MRDPFAIGALADAEAWEREAGNREQRAPGVPDPVAATLKTCAAEIRARVESIDRDTAYLTCAQYADTHGSSEQTIRRLCRAGLIEGAEKDVNEDWRIPRHAKRRAKSA